MLEIGRISELKRDDGEHPVPPYLRTPFHQISEAFAQGDFDLSQHVIKGVGPIDPAVAQSIVANVSAYGDELAPLDASAWDSAVYRWMDGWWQFLVDMTTAGEKVSDLTLHAKLHDNAPHRIEVQSVHVP